MGKLKALLLTEGMHGMISQVEGMAKALNTEYTHKVVRLSFPWNLIPPKFTPISQIVLKEKIYITNNEIPDIVISCGRKSVIPSIFIKKQNSKIFTIHIQDPKVNFKNFDAIVAPEHDNLKGDNIYTSKGAIHYITELEISKASQYLADKIKSEKIVSLILGGPNKYYSFNPDQIVNIFNKIKTIFVSNGYKVIMIPSMRTPKEIIDLAIREMGSCGHVVNKVDKQAYLSAYALADYVIVTCDSTSMISEAATSGKPIFVAHMEEKKNNYKIIVIPSMRTPKISIELAIKEFSECGYVVNHIDKQAYLSALALANNVVVTCDSTSMISEAASSGKPIYVAHMKAKKNNYRFKRFFKLFKEMGITRDLSDKVENWTYNKINEAERIANTINSKIRN